VSNNITDATNTLIEKQEEYIDILKRMVEVQKATISKQAEIIEQLKGLLGFQR
jgi:hypothetical protein